MGYAEEHKINLMNNIPMFDQIQRVDTLVRCNVCGTVVDGDVVGTTQHLLWHSKQNFAQATGMETI